MSIVASDDQMNSQDLRNQKHRDQNDLLNIVTSDKRRRIVCMKDQTPRERCLLGMAGEGVYQRFY